MKILSMEFF